MALQIANPDVVAKVEQLAKSIGVSETDAVERAVDQMLEKQGQISSNKNSWDEIRKLLYQFDQLPRNPDFVDPLQWDENGLPI